MATAQDADLIIKLYELRREETMRKARNFFFYDFFPEGIEDVKALFANKQQPELNAYYRQVTSYWDMAAAMVNHGSIDQSLFFDTNGEFFAVWAKICDFIDDLRAFFGPQYLVNLEKMVAAHPHGAKRLDIMKARYKTLAEQRKQK